MLLHRRVPPWGLRILRAGCVNCAALQSYTFFHPTAPFYGDGLALSYSLQVGTGRRLKE